MKQSNGRRAMSPDPGPTGGGVPPTPGQVPAKTQTQAPQGDRPARRPDTSRPVTDEDDEACGRGTQPE